MKKVLLFTVEFLSPIALGTKARCLAFSKAFRKAVEKPLKTEMGFKVGESSPNHWIMDIWCYNLEVTEEDLGQALSALKKWMCVIQPIRRQVRGILAVPPEDKLTSRLKDRTPEKRLAHKEAQKRHLQNLDDAYGKDRPYSHKVLD